jgi:hypothetical protein
MGELCSQQHILRTFFILLVSIYGKLWSHERSTFTLHPIQVDRAVPEIEVQSFGNLFLPSTSVLVLAIGVGPRHLSRIPVEIIPRGPLYGLRLPICPVKWKV